MITICTWLWGDSYSPVDVLKLKRGIDRHLNQPHRFIVMTERLRVWSPPEGIERYPIIDHQLCAFKGCFARLRMFDYGWQEKRKIDDRLVCLDLDIIITGNLDSLFDRPEPFVILGGANSMNPCPYNGSVMMIRPGHHGEVWTDFSVKEITHPRIKFYQFPDDQGWLHYKIPDAATWPAGRRSGIFAFKKPGWPINNDSLPLNARIVAFPGARRPGDFMRLTWVRENWL